MLTFIIVVMILYMLTCLSHVIGDKHSLLPLAGFLAYMFFAYMG